MERALGRAVAIGLPIVCAVAAVITGLAAGGGAALLVLAGGALLGAVGFFWASVRTLSGDAPVGSGLEASARGTPPAELEERKRRAFRAVKDLDTEHALGKIDDADYEELRTRYRDEAKTVMRELDAQVAPRIEEAERLARDYLKERGLVAGEPRVAGGAESRVAAGTSPPPVRTEERVACQNCDASNEPDASFCKQCGANLREQRHAHA